ncbi:1-pyrroline-5-carboxylate dehydrogenase [Paenarthrobacter nitroguajacolicus]|uniref:aldehyde dehydrogenase family protein n=1 Tax=Paenarthrobacter nitroguajacolicus TaxID=211146 RepID=UPI00285A769A|nr:aldehyde dehydrogenase family protein [Paenarthrobacter nitroguajacolicus]MDR6989152.1 1-pyrroline-5-carboxylate dehydrogenase [Paenarthrobacter nitroguajacolicus]
MNITIDPHEFASKVADQRGAEPVIVPHVIGGAEYFDGPITLREDPTYPDRSVSGAHEASDELVQKAVATARSAQREWESVPAVERAAKVRVGIDYVFANALDWSTRLAVETGKSIAAIEAEVDEVRGFLDVYSSFASEPDHFVDELNGSDEFMTSETILRPYGVFGVITPFNYPIALAAGLSIGAVLAGNGLVIKTSHQGPWSGQAVYELFAAMDLPVGLVNIVHGGDAPAKALVSAEIDGIGFTGSASVGHSIIRQLSSGPFVKPVIAEMGGKNPVIVTETADIDAASKGIIYSAYDLAGQKCSSGSRILTTPDAYDALVQGVGERVKALRFGDTVEGREVFAGPLTSQEAVDRYERTLAMAQEAGFTVISGSRPEGKGYFAAPVVIAGVPEDHDLARNEHFLPLITISKVETFQDALKAANDVSLGLTAGIFTGKLAEANEFLDRIEAGCINVNGRGHATTGFLPGKQTFGGWKASGSTGKQGYGKWYLQQFAREQTRKFPAGYAGLS